MTDAVADRMPDASRGDSAFDPRVVLALLLFGALAFLAALYFIGTNQTGGSENDGQAHAASRGLTGYAALAEYLEAEGHTVRVSRSRSAFDEPDLLVLTPPRYADAETVAEVLDERRYTGPTLLILPKWNAAPASFFTDEDVEEGWVRLGKPARPEWTEELPDETQKLDRRTYLDAPKFMLALGKQSQDWAGLGSRGRLTRPDVTQSFAPARDAGNMTPLVSTTDNAPLIAYLDDGGIYPAYEAAAMGREISYDEDDYAGSQYGIIVVAEPDLFNNYGFSDRSRAQLAHAVVDLAMDGGEYDVVFDVTLNGLGGGENLLTLAFTPPFLAATLCLLIAMFVVGWRAMLRFGPAVAEDRAIAFGKTQLVRNGADFIRRTGRLHLLAGPYAALMRAKLADALSLDTPDDATLDAAFARRLPDETAPTRRLAELRNARTPTAMLHAAEALRTFERKLRPS
ncbi:MAG: DUF4350 domain-containing protein [Parerythrobacter sp.]